MLSRIRMGQAKKSGRFGAQNIFSQRDWPYDFLCLQKVAFLFAETTFGADKESLRAYYFLDMGRIF